MACDNICAKIVSDVTFDCTAATVGGLEQVVKLINKCDITLTDWTISRTLTDSACTHLISDYDTGEETDPKDLNAVTVTGIPGKRLLNASFAPTNTDFGVRYVHNVQLYAQSLTKDTVCLIKALGKGAEVVAIVEQKNKSTNGESSFWVYGWDAGLKLGDFTFDHNENNGGAIIPLTSIDPDTEPDPPIRLFMTDYETTKVFFDTL